MKILSIDTDEAQRLDIRCKAGRTFDVEINIAQQDLSGTFKMEVRSEDGGLMLTFNDTDGLTVGETQVRLLKAASAMAIPTGVYHYDLIQATANAVNNLMFGNFIVQPSYTQWP